LAGWSGYRQYHFGFAPEGDMKDEEYRALVAAGPAVVMVAKEDMLKLLERLIITEKQRQSLYLQLSLVNRSILDND